MIEAGLGLATAGSPCWTCPLGIGQPMSGADGRYALTYNGETYSFQALRAELLPGPPVRDGK